MKYLIALLLLSGCASKPILVKDCSHVEGNDNIMVCKKL